MYGWRFQNVLFAFLFRSRSWLVICQLCSLSPAATLQWTAPTALKPAAHLSNASPASPFRAGQREPCSSGSRPQQQSKNRIVNPLSLRCENVQQWRYCSSFSNPVFCIFLGVWFYVNIETCIYRRLGLDVRDFGPSWRTGVAFLAVIFALRPHLVNMERAWRRPNRDNLEEAFLLAERELGIPRLLDPEGYYNNNTDYCYTVKHLYISVYM